MLELMVRFVWFNEVAEHFSTEQKLRSMKRKRYSCYLCIDYILSMKSRRTKRDNHKLQIASMFHGQSDKDKWDSSSDSTYLSRQASLLSVQMKRRKKSNTTSKKQHIKLLDYINVVCMFKKWKTQQIYYDHLLYTD